MQEQFIKKNTKYLKGLVEFILHNFWNIRGCNVGRNEFKKCLCKPQARKTSHRIRATVRPRVEFCVASLLVRVSGSDATLPPSPPPVRSHSVRFPFIVNASASVWIMILLLLCESCRIGLVNIHRIVYFPNFNFPLVNNPKKYNYRYVFQFLCNRYNLNLKKKFNKKLITGLSCI